MTLQEFLFRLALAILLGGIVGYERDVQGRPAGFRTNMFVCIGSALFTMVSFHANTGDPGRIAAQIVSGIGFLGGGTILKMEYSIRGLTTAACMWFVAAIGMLCGIGWRHEAVITTLSVMAVMAVARRAEQYMPHRYAYRISLTADSDEHIRRIRQFAADSGDLRLTAITLAHKSAAETIKIIITIELSTRAGQVEGELTLARRLQDNGLLGSNFAIECAS